MVIYKAIFPNGKVYIGKSKSFDDRKNKHFYSPRYYNTKMSNAINKYGFESIIWEVIFETDDPIILNQKEREFIIKYDSKNIGYNTSDGGDGGDTISKNPRRIDIIKQQLNSKGYDSDSYYVEISDIISKSIIDDYINNKLSLKMISTKYKISRQRITRFLISKGIEIDKDRIKISNSVKITDDDVKSAIDKYKGGKNIKDISSELNQTIQTISRILHDSGVRISKRFKDGKRYDGKQPKNK